MLGTSFDFTGFIISSLRICNSIYKKDYKLLTLSDAYYHLFIDITLQLLRTRCARMKEMVFFFKLIQFATFNSVDLKKCLAQIL